MSSDYGLKFYIQPEVDQRAAAKAEAKLDQVVAQAAAAAKAGNEDVLRQLNLQAHRMMKKGGNPTVTVDVKTEVSSTTGALKEVKRLSASALDPLIKDYQKMTDIQGEAALNVKKEISLQKQSLATLRQKQALLGRNSKKFKENARAQKEVVDQTKALERALAKVRTLASMKGQLRDESQKLSMMNQYNVGLNQQGQLVTSVNQKWLEQKKVVQGLSGQVNAAGVAAKGFGAKVAAAGQGMQAAFGWIAAVVAGLTAVAGAVGAITGRAKDIQAIKLTFDGLGQSVDAQNAILDSAKNIALSYGVSLRKVEGAFRRLGPAILESGGSLKDTEGAIKSIAARTTMLGLNTEQTGRYIEAFAQVMGKGKLQSEELNQQFSELDGGLRGQLKNWLAANKGITDFEKAMKNGEITAGVFLEAFEAINEEIRQKFLRSIGDTQQAIETLGQKGGMTLNQLNAKMQTLTSIGLEAVGEALAPLGKELMKVYAAFVQVFTKIATEMPALQDGFKLVGRILGVVLKGAINMIIVSFGILMQTLDAIIDLVQRLYKLIKSIPVIGDAVKGIEAGINSMNDGFDKAVDNWAKLSDQTIGATSELQKYNNEMDNLRQMRANQEITDEQYYKKVADLEARRMESLRKNADQRLEIETNNMNQMIERREAQLSREKEIMDRKIAGINEAKEQESRAIDETISMLEEQKQETKEVYDDKIDNIKKAALAAKRAIEDEISALKSAKAEQQRVYRDKMALVKEHYAELKSQMDETHSKDMAQMDARIARLRAAQAAEMRSYDMGPEQKRLNEMKILDLKRQAAAESDRLARQEILAEIERMENAKKRQQAEVRHAQQMRRAQEQKAALEKKQAEEKKRLDEEEKKRLADMRKQQQDTLDGIARMLEALTAQKRQDARDEKDSIAEVKEARDESMEAFGDQIDDLKAKQKESDDDAKRAIEQLKEKYEDQKRVVQDIQWELKKTETAVGNVGTRIDQVTNGALERQLRKVIKIRTELNKIAAAKKSAEKNGSSSTTPAGKDLDGARASGGSVRGGGTYQVNELGKEGFLSASGKLSQISAPSFGHWKAPSSGTVIPAHIWKTLKTNQQASITMPKTVNPGNATARAISTINNTAGSQYNNSVTIQSVNPVQDANNMMVQMQRLRRGRR